MIIKSISKKGSIKQTIQYLFKDEKKLSDATHESFLIRKNVRTKSLEKWVKEFEQNEKSRIYKRKDAVKVYHTVISFNNKDSKFINEKLLKDIANKYMNLQGNDNMYIGTAHFDQEHIHLHIVVSGTKYLIGKANRLSKQKFKQLKLQMEIFQRKHYPELTNSLPNHNKQTAKEYQHNPNVRNTQKELLQKCLLEAFSKSNSLTGFIAAIRQQGHEPYYRGDKLTGIKYNGVRKYRLNKLGYDIEKLEEQYRKNTIEKNQLTELQTIRNNSNSINKFNETKTENKYYR